MKKLQAGLLSASLIAIVAPRSFASYATESAPRIDEVRLVGARAHRSEGMLNELATQPGGTFDSEAIAADIKRLWKTSRYDDVRVSVARDGRVVVFHVHRHVLADDVDKIGGAVVEAIEIVGNTKTKDSVIRRELAISAGEPLTRTSIETSGKRIRALGFFDKVEARVRHGSTPKLAVVVFTVKERATGNFEVGASYGEISGLGFTAAVAQDNLFGTGNALAMKARVAQSEQRFELGYQDRRMLGSQWTGEASIYTRRQALLGWEHDRLGGAVSARRLVGDRTLVRLGYRLERLRTVQSADVSALLQGADVFSRELSGLTSAVRADVIHDSRRGCSTKVFSVCQSGFTTGGYGEVASKLLGSTNQFERAGVWASLPIALSSNVGIVVSGAVDGITSVAGEVPIAERLHVGGARQVRGYELGELSPWTTDPRTGAPVLGGNFRVVASAELHFPLLPFVGISGVVFADAGNAFNIGGKRPSLSGSIELLRGLRASVGAGLRWASPIGRLRFDWGVPLHRRPGDPPVRFHFGLE